MKEMESAFESLTIRARLTNVVAQNWCAGGANTQGRKIITTERPVAAFAMTKATY